MQLFNIKKQSGVGLVEVLVAVVIVALGLLALGSFEGNLLKSSGETKARSEAVSLAEQKIEEFRNKVQLAEHNSMASGNDTVNGTNATFIRTWTVTDVAAFLPTAPARKEIEVNVLWGPADDRQQVVTVSEIAWIDPAKSILAAPEDGGGTAAVPSPRQNASEDVASENVFNSPNSPVTSGTPGTSKQITVQVNELDADGNIINTTNPVLKQIAKDSRYYATDDVNNFFVEPGVIAVFVCDTNLSCRYIQNHFGGVSLRTRGKVYSNTGTLGNINVAWTSSDVNACYVSPAGTTTINGQSVGVKSYECVYAGNCDAVPAAMRDGLGNFDAATGIFPNGNGCSTNVSVDQIQSRNVGPGGEFGDVGLLGLDSQGNGREKVCFLEDTSNYTLARNVLTNDPSGTPSPEDYYLPVTKRLYVSRRMNNDGSQTSEGINRSYVNHNFMIIERGSTAGSYENCYRNLFTSNTSGNPRFYGYNLDPNIANHIALGMREIVRVMSTNNMPIPESVYLGGTGPSKTIITPSVNNILSNFNDLRIYISEGGTCYKKTDNTKYACAVPSNATTVLIQAGSRTLPNSATLYNQCSKDINIIGSASELATPCIWPTNFAQP